MKIGPYEIGKGRTFVVAECGLNHGGDLRVAFRLIDEAADCEADAVKFQAFRAEELGAPDLARYELPPEAWRLLALRAESRGLAFFASVFDCESADLVDPYVPCFKIPSGELTNEKLLRHVAGKGKPVILSTGMATADEWMRARFDIAWPIQPPIVLHCVSAYPAPTAEMNLRVIPQLAQTVGRRAVGLSDHTLSLVIPIAAVAMGACMIEKHFTTHLGGAGPDHPMSLNAITFSRMVQDIRTVEAAMGDGAKRCMPCEEETRRRARRDTVTGKRPCAG